jgi:membrane protein implicated in regulation of membrane protease activity
LLAVFGVASLIAAAIAAVALALPVWAAALIVGAAVLSASGVAALLSKKQAGEATPPAPQTVANVKQDVQQLKGSRHDRT